MENDNLNEERKDEIYGMINNMAKNMPMDKFMQAVKDTGSKESLVEQYKNAVRAENPDLTNDQLNDLVNEAFEQIIEREGQITEQNMMGNKPMEMELDGSNKLDQLESKLNNTDEKISEDKDDKDNGDR